MFVSVEHLPSVRKAVQSLEPQKQVNNKIMVALVQSHRISEVLHSIG